MVFLLLLIAIASSGCTKTLDVSRIEALSPQEGVVYGRINVRMDGKEQNWGGRNLVQDAMRMSAGGQGEFRIFVQSENTNDLMLSMLAEDGSFFWKLPYGKYNVLSYEWKWYEVLVYKWLKGQLHAEFELSPACQVCYVGTIVLDVDRVRSRLHQVRVVDEEAHATYKLGQVSTGLPTTIGKRLVRIEQPL